MRIALLEMLHPDAAPADHPIPPEGAIDEAVETAKTFCGADAPGFVNGILAAVAARDAARMERRHDRSRHQHPRRRSSRAWSAPPSSCAAATSSTDAAAGLVEDCAALAGQASAELERMARATAAEPIPGQDTLL